MNFLHKIGRRDWIRTNAPRFSGVPRGAIIRGKSQIAPPCSPNSSQNSSQWLVLALALLAFPVHAELSITKERNTTLLRSSVKVTLTKQSGGLIACMIPLDDVIAGEQIDLRGIVNTTNDQPDLIGVTSEIMVWENGAWANLRADEPNQPDDSDLDGQNVARDVQHHLPYVSFADYSTRNYAGRVWFGVGVWAYRKPNPYGTLTLHTCSIRAVRVRP